MTSLENSRRAILKLKGAELADSAAFSDAIQSSIQRRATSETHDLLSLLLVIFKHLRAAVQTNDTSIISFVASTITSHLAPALTPGQPLADVLVYSVESSDKISLLRASDVLGAACRLAVEVSETAATSFAGDFLVPLFQHVASGPMTSKGSLIIINQTIDSVPVNATPEAELLLAITSQLASADYASIRSSIFVSHWLKKRATKSSQADAVERSMLSCLLPDLTNDDESAHSIVMARNLSKYLLPAVFKAFPKSCLILLDMLQRTETTDDEAEDNGARFRSWIRVASLGSTLGVISLADLARSRVVDAIGHADPEIRRQAFELLAGQQDTNVLLSEDTVALFKLVLEYNSVLPASNTRTEWASAVHLFFSRLLAAQLTVKRLIRRPAGEEEKALAQAQVGRLDAFISWMFADVIDPALVSARRPPSYRIIVALITLQNYLTIFAADPDRLSPAFTPHRVQLLIGCQACEFAEVRARSHAILKMAPTPLPGYASLAESSTRTLLESAWAGFANPRKTQNDAAVAALQIVFERVVLPRTADDEYSEAIGFATDVADRLEAELTRAETGLRGGLEDLALHGPVAGCRALVACVDLAQPASQEAWRPLFHRLADFVHRIWRLTRTVMSLSASSTEQAGATDGPAHEIAKAYQVLSSGQDDEGEDDLDPRRLISDCWRATKEAGELLATLIAHPLTQAGDKQEIWARDEVDAAGRTYLQWLHEIRHRGTFSAISAAFAELVDTVRKVKSLRDLPAIWLDLEIRAITDDSLSTTRRSAALPYSLLSIVAGDSNLLDIAVTRLLDLARIDNDASSDITRVHAFNILKIVLLDARQSKFLPKYFENTVMTAVEAFPSPNWNVRNVALMNFSTLVNRSLQSARTSQHMYSSRAALEGRQTFAAWHAKYPRILPYITTYLRRCTAGEVDGAHTALFPMLIILRSLQWSEEGERDGVQGELREVLEPYLGSREWQVRQVTAQSLSSLYSPEAAIDIFTQLDVAASDALNVQHGNVMLAHNLMTNTLPLLEGAALQNVGEAIGRMVEHVQRLRNGSQGHLTGPIEGEVWATLSAFQRSTDSAPEVLQKAADVARAALLETATRIDGCQSGQRNTYVDLDSSERDRSRVRAACCGNESFPVSLADTVVLLKHQSDAVVSSIIHLGGTTRHALQNSVEAVTAVLDVALDEKRNHELRLEAMKWICDVESSVRDIVVQRHISGEEQEALYKRVQAILGSRNTLLREQGMVLLAWVLAGHVTARLEAGEEERNLPSAFAILAQRIRLCSQEDKSQPSRDAAASALSHLAPALFPSSTSSNEGCIDAPSMLAYQQSILALLQDDDEDIRLQVAQSVRVQLGSKTPVCQAVALKMWWIWCGTYMSTLQGAHREAWAGWIRDLAQDEAGYQEDLAALVPPVTTAKTELFEQEKPNLFRDPLIDAQYAVDLLFGRPQGVEPIERAAPSATEGYRASPIDAAFAAAILLPRREKLRVACELSQPVS